MKEKNPAKEIQNYLQGKANQKERALVEAWYEKFSDEQPDQEIPFNLKQQIEEDRRIVHSRIKPNRLKPIAIAASIVLALSFGIYIYIASELKPATHELVQYDANTGSNRATLTLADGSTINLSDNHDGIIIGTDSISYTDGTSLFVDGNSSPFVIQRNEGSLPAKQATLLTLTTPKGGQYQVTLPDGTKVWLNAASTLKYPNRFDGKDRRVELEGEAYFEVTPRPETRDTKPESRFIVTSNNQEVTVLGTHFNITAYPDEKETRTTLLEGSVLVSSIPSTHAASRDPRLESRTAKLTPNQQSTITASNTNIQIETIDPETAIDWKNGDFVFKGEDLKGAMRKIARWYDMEIIYEPNAPTHIELGGWISRKNNLSAVLKWIESTSKVHFKIEERRIIVMK